MCQYIAGNCVLTPRHAAAILLFSDKTNYFPKTDRCYLGFCVCFNYKIFVNDLHSIAIYRKTIKSNKIIQDDRPCRFF